MPRRMVYEIPGGTINSEHFTASLGHEQLTRRLKAAHVRAFNEPDPEQRQRDKDRLRRLIGEFKVYSQTARAAQSGQYMPMPAGAALHPN